MSKSRNLDLIYNDIGTIRDKVDLIKKGLHFHINDRGHEILNEITGNLSDLRQGISDFQTEIYKGQQEIEKILRSIRINEK